LVGAHRGRSSAAHPAHQALAMAGASANSHYAKGVAVFDDVHLVTFVGPVPLPKFGRDGHLALAVQTHTCS
jgi:hypothetical protein